MSQSVTLTREQWDALFDGLDLIRDTANRTADVADALKLLGMSPAGTLIAEIEDAIADHTIRLTKILIRADDAIPSTPAAE